MHKARVYLAMRRIFFVPDFLFEPILTKFCGKHLNRQALARFLRTALLDIAHLRTSLRCLRIASPFVCAIASCLPYTARLSFRAGVAVFSSQSFFPMAPLRGALLALAATAGATPCHLTNTYGDHMVLQRAPAAAIMFGFADAGTTVKVRRAAPPLRRRAAPPAPASVRDAAAPFPPCARVQTVFAGTTYQTSADATGVWRQALPPTPASAAGVTISFSCSTGENFAVSDVLFGEVVICGGQSKCVRSSACARALQQRVSAGGGAASPSLPPSASLARALDPSPPSMQFTVGCSAWGLAPLRVRSAAACAPSPAPLAPSPLPARAPCFLFVAPRARSRHADGLQCHRGN